MPTTIEQRSKELVPTVLLTLASIIQALALEVLWNRAMEAEHLWRSGPALVVGWLQVIAVLQLIVLVWVFYAHLVLRLSWVPCMRDSTVPFVLGVAEFALCAMLAPEQLHLWFYLCAALFLFTQFAVYANFAAAEKEPENAWFFEAFPRDTWIRHGPAIFTVSVFAMLGFAVSQVGPSGVVALVAVLIANAVMTAQLLMQHLYWTRSLEERKPEPIAADPGGEP